MDLTENVPHKLKDQLANNNIVIFIGSGISKKSGYPNWIELTTKILKEIEEKEPKAIGYVEALEKNLFDPIEILNKIEYLRTDVIEALAKIFSEYRNIPPSQLHKKILSLSSSIVTSNYDNLLEHTDFTFEKVNYYNNFKIAKLNTYEKYILKLHGDIEEPDKCIIFQKDYEKLYTISDSAIFEFLKMISNKSFLFIGFSMKDPYINYLLKFIEKLYSGFSPEHYIITTDKIQADIKRLIPINIEDFSKLESYIDRLIEYKKNIILDTDKLILDKELKEEFEYNNIYDYDLPPNVRHWVGRKKELQNIANDNFRVVFVTGIGGQGKSALVSYFLKEKFDSELYEFGDWRDFKEETNRFQTKLISIIKRLSKDKINASNLDSATNQELIDIFFHYLGKRKIVFVFDNIDSYVDLETFLPVGGIGLLFRSAIDRPHNSKFIFTCRPFIKTANVNFYQIQLDGLSLEETFKLFQYYNPPMSIENMDLFCQKVHKLTKGHPLWLNLIAAQSLRGENIAEDFILGIESKTEFVEENFSAILSQNILSKVWFSLNSKQQYLIRAIAETVKSETIDNLKKILDKELSNHQFDRAIKTLGNLNLIETKASIIGEEEIELHPLVREFVLTKFHRSERAKFITLLVKYYDGFIYILKPKLSSNLPLSAFQNWTSKIELEINKADYKSALIVLQEIHSPIVSAGYIEEYIRVADRLFKEIDWSIAIENEYPYFHQQLIELCEQLADFHRHSDCNQYLDKYAKLIPGKSNYYLSLLSTKCYVSWLKDEFETAIRYGEEGEYLLSESNLTDTNSLRHNLALARRDSMAKDNIVKALDYFSQNENIDEILQTDKIKPELGGHYYGNVGRCYEYLGQKDIAFRCYIISINLLMTSDYFSARKNIGYACDWIAALLVEKKKIDDAAYFMKFGLFIWELTSPILYNKLIIKWQGLKSTYPNVKRIDQIAEWQTEKVIKDFILNYLKR